MENRVIVYGGGPVRGKYILVKRLLTEQYREPDVDVWYDELVENPFPCYVRESRSGTLSSLLLRLMSVISRPEEN